MTEVANDIKQTKSLSSKTQGIAQQRALSCGIRDSQGSVKDAKSVAGAGRSVLQEDSKVFDSVTKDFHEIVGKIADTNLKQLPAQLQPAASFVHGVLFSLKKLVLGLR